MRSGRRSARVVAAWGHSRSLGRTCCRFLAASARDFQGNVEEFGSLEREQTKAIRKGLKVMCRECQMGVAAAELALSDAGLTFGKTDSERTGIVFGSDYMISLPEEFTEGVLQCLDEDGRFQFSRWAAEGMPKMSPLWLLKYLPNMPASHLAIYNDFRGPNNSLTLREAAAGAAIGEAYQILVRDRADTMVVGATGTRLNPTKIIHAMQQEELATGNGDPTRASRPFDRNRTGMVLGEGAGAIVLEELSSAQARRHDLRRSDGRSDQFGGFSQPCRAPRPSPEERAGCGLFRNADETGGYWFRSRSWVEHAELRYR